MLIVTQCIEISPQIYQVEQIPQQQQPQRINLKLQFQTIPQNLQEQKIKVIQLSDYSQHIFIATQQHLLHYIENQGQFQMFKVHDFQNVQYYQITALFVENTKIFVCFSNKQEKTSKIFQSQISQLVDRGNFSLFQQINNFVQTFCVIDDKIVYVTEKNDLIGQEQQHVTILYDGKNSLDSRIISPIYADMTVNYSWFVSNEGKESKLYCLNKSKQITHPLQYQSPIRAIAKNFILLKNGQLYDIETQEMFMTSDQFTNLFMINRQLILIRGQKLYHFDSKQTKLKAVTVCKDTPQFVLNTEDQNIQIVISQNGNIDFLDIFQNKRVKDKIDYNDIIQLSQKHFIVQQDNILKISTIDKYQNLYQAQYHQNCQTFAIKTKIIQYNNTNLYVFDCLTHKENNYQLQDQDCQDFLFQIVNNMLIIVYKCKQGKQLQIYYEDETTNQLQTITKVDYSSLIVGYKCYKNQYYLVETQNELYILNLLEKQQHIILKKNMEIYKQLQYIPINYQVFLLILQQQLILFNQQRPLNSQILDNIPQSAFYYNNIIFILTNINTIELYDVCTLNELRTIYLDEQINKDAVINWELDNDQQIYLSIIQKDRKLIYKISF